MKTLKNYTFYHITDGEYHYIGQTYKTLAIRFKNHIKTCKYKETWDKQPFYKWLYFYWSNDQLSSLTKEIIYQEYCKKTRADQIETELIAAYRNKYGFSMVLNKSAGGTGGHGPATVHSAFTWDDIYYIRSQYPNRTLKDIADQYNTNFQTISKIVRNVTWYDPELPTYKSETLEEKYERANAIRRYWVDGYTANEIGEMFGISGKHVRTFLRNKVCRDPNWDPITKTFFE